MRILDVITFVGLTAGGVAAAEPDSRLEELEARLDEMELAADDPSGPTLKLAGFSHVQFVATDDGDQTSNAFAMGGLDLFISSQLSDRVSFLNETVFEPTDEGENVLDVERVIIKVVVSDALNIQAGRFHTSIGFWNEAFHHGEWLQTSIGRPTILNFEDEAGMLPIHMIGVVLNGRLRTAPLTIDYTLEVGNGRGVSPDPPQITVDANKGKAVNARLGFSPSAIPGLRFGGGAYVDQIPENTDATVGRLHGEIDELIISGFLTYKHRAIEVMGEYIGITHEGDGSASSSGYYGQLGYRFGAFIPFVRYDAVAVDDKDTFFSSVDDSKTMAAGVRWESSTYAVIKAQMQQTVVTPAAGDEQTTKSAIVQTAFAF